MSDALLGDVERPPRRQRSRRRRTRYLVGALAVLAVLVVWGYLAVSQLLEARDRAERGRNALEALAEADPLEGDLERTRERLHRAQEELAGARAALGSGVLVPLRPLPVVGRQLASARALATAAERVVATLTPAVDRVVEGRAAGSQPQERMALLADLESHLSAGQAVLADLDLGPDEALVAPLATARVDAEVQLAELGESVEQALTVVRGMRSFLGRSSYLVAAANPAEMSNAGGMFLSVGGLDTADGELRLDEFLHSHELFPVEAGPVEDPDVAARWGHLIPGNDFRKLNITPRFAGYVGPQSLELWEAVSGARPDGVIVVDATVVQALLDVVGPVEVEGRTYDAESILDYALAGQYEEFGDFDGQTERRELVASIAQAAVNAMGSRSWDPFDLIRALRPTAEGRHLLAYSEDPVEQAMWSAIGVDGNLTGHELMVNLASVGGHKIDPFVSIEVNGRFEAAGDGSTLALDVAVTNATPSGISRFALGAYEAFDVEPGTYIGRLAIFAPGTTRRVEVAPELAFEAYGPDGDLFVAAGRVEIPPGATETFHVKVQLADASPVVVLPSARLPAVTWRVDGETWRDSAPRTIEPS